MTTHNIKGFKTPKKGAWLGVFQPNWQNYKIVTSPMGNIGPIPNFDRVIDPHSWLLGWSRITKFIFKMADGRHIAKCWKRYNSPINGPIWMKRGWSDPIMSMSSTWWDCHGNDRDGIMSSTWWDCHGNDRCLATVHWKIQQLWASVGRMREPILFKFGLQQQIRRSTMTVTSSNIKILKIQNGWRLPCWKIFEMP